MNRFFPLSKQMAQKLGKKVVITISAIFIVGAINAQTKIAILDFKAGAGVEQVNVDGISAIFSTYFIDPTKFTLVERTQIERVIDEQGFQYSSLTEKQMVRIGEILNLSKMVIGDINIIGGQYNIDVRIVNAQTGEVEATDGATWIRNSSYRELMKNLANRLITKISSNQSAVTKDSHVITLLGYLRVFPEDLGKYSDYPRDIVQQINNNKTYGYNNWRLPTEAELQTMIQNADKLGLKKTRIPYDMGPDYHYFYQERSKDGENYWRQVRLVSTGN